jgi:hypothetical protein
VRHRWTRRVFNEVLGSTAEPSTASELPGMRIHECVSWSHHAWWSRGHSGYLPGKIPGALRWGFGAWDKGCAGLGGRGLGAINPLTTVEDHAHPYQLSVFWRDCCGGESRSERPGKTTGNPTESDLQRELIAISAYSQSCRIEVMRWETVSITVNQVKEDRAIGVR